MLKISECVLVCIRLLKARNSCKPYVCISAQINRAIMWSSITKHLVSSWAQALKMKTDVRQV